MIATVRIWPINGEPRIVRVECEDDDSASDAEIRCGACFWPMWAERRPEFVGWDLSESVDLETFFEPPIQMGTEWFSYETILP